MTISGWIYFVVGGCLGIALATGLLLCAFWAERRDWAKSFTGKDMHLAYFIGFEDGRKWDRK